MKIYHKQNWKIFSDKKILSNETKSNVLGFFPLCVFFVQAYTVIVCRDNGWWKVNRQMNHTVLICL